MRVVICLVCVSLFSIGHGVNKTPPHQADLNQLMSPKEQQETGVNKLNKQQREALSRWINNFALQQRTTAAHDVSNLHVTSSLLSLNIYKGSYLQLENGTVWEIEPIDRRVASSWLYAARIRVIPQPGKDFPFLLVNEESNRAIHAKVSSLNLVPSLDQTASKETYKTSPKPKTPSQTK